MTTLPKHIIEKMAAQREKGNKFNSLVIDSSFMENRLRAIFDHEWVYDPHRSSIHEINRFEDKVSR